MQADVSLCVDCGCASRHLATSCIWCSSSRSAKPTFV